MNAFGAALLLTLTAVGCSPSPFAASSQRPPTPSPSRTPQDPSTLVVFNEPATGFSTSDVHDAHDRIVQFTIGGDLVWTPDGTHIPGYPVAPDSYHGFQPAGNGR
jgi:hypothetical protein